MNDGCPIGSKSHNAHDERIRELEEFKSHVSRTPRMLAERVAKLERLVKAIREGKIK